MWERRERRGFTLIELLVVIAIIAILAAILFPVFAQARDKARMTACLNNMKQIGTALAMYAQDYDETLPAWPFGAGGRIADARFTGGWQWAMWVDALMPYVKNTGVFSCPSGPTNFLRGPANNRINVNLAYNEYIMNSNRGWASLAKLASARNGIAEISVVADSVTPGIYQDWHDRNTRIPGRPPTFGLYRMYCANGISGGGTTCRGRHTEHGVNVAYADGHAKFVPGGRIQGGSADPRGEHPIVNPDKPNLFR